MMVCGPYGRFVTGSRLAARSLAFTRRLPVEWPPASYWSGRKRRTSARIWNIVYAGADPFGPKHDAKGPLSASGFVCRTVRSCPRNFAPYVYCASEFCAKAVGSLTIVSQYSHAARISAGDPSAFAGIPLMGMVPLTKPLTPAPPGKSTAPVT